MAATSEISQNIGFSILTSLLMKNTQYPARSSDNKRVGKVAITEYQARRTTSSRLLKKTHMLRCRSIASLEPCSWYVFVFVRILDHVFTGTSTTIPPRIWIFLSSLQEAFFSTVLGVCPSNGHFL